MSDLLSVPPIPVASRERIVPSDVLFLRKHLFPEGLTSADDAAALMAIHRSCDDRCPEWDRWFVESLTAFAVVHSWPQHSLDDINADWLIAMIADDGIVQTSAELQLLLHVIEVSRHVPQQLSALAIDQLRWAIESGQGAYAAGRTGKRHGIGPEDIAFLYRILKGSAHAGKLLLGSDEIASLMALGRAVAGGRNHPAWNELVDAVSPRRLPEGASPRPWLRMLEPEPYAVDEAVA
jgi:hypothetical protein